MLDTSTDRRWYALRVAPQKERIVSWLLHERFGIDAFVPVETRYRRQNRYCKGKVELEFAVAPGYVFAGFDAGIPWLTLQRIRHIYGIVGYHERPWRIDSRRGEPNPAFWSMLTSYRNGELRAPKAQRHMRTHAEFGIGDEVDVIEGAWRDHRVKVIEITGSQAKFIMRLFGNEQAVHVPLAFLERAA